ncbi:Hsp20/alpha crystallin family protein [Halorhabdus sp. BNX81]|uniref:Hsp20/alpha crystallin family protein n=1 Tax=Halorhabdus sp. BNX81 TaxID=2980181 RepID=UPI0023DD460B|nr:Hsp20/alpha crystallin family protein [Halorhabdus sp. BNX81]WEL20284.1 Molecular chaperone (HSP20 family) [Halorhabdus sp. BNX81]
MPSKPNPFDEIERMFDRMSDQFEALDPTEVAGAVTGSAGGIAVDVVDEGDRFVLTADVPGYDSDDIDVTLPDATTMRISAERTDATESEHSEPDDGVFIRRERRRTATSRTVSLPEPVDEDGTAASYQHGVLTVELPKERPDAGDSRTIPIE